MSSQRARVGRHTVEEGLRVVGEGRHGEDHAGAGGSMPPRRPHRAGEPHRLGRPPTPRLACRPRRRARHAHERPDGMPAPGIGNVAADALTKFGEASLDVPMGKPTPGIDNVAGDALIK